MHTFSARNVDEVKGGLLEQAVGKLSLNDLNRILYRCDAEEKDDGKGFKTYHLDVYGNMKYCGLQGNNASNIKKQKKIHGVRGCRFPNRGGGGLYPPRGV